MVSSCRRKASEGSYGPIRTVSAGLKQLFDRFGTHENMSHGLGGTVSADRSPNIAYAAAQRLVSVGCGVTER